MYAEFSENLVTGNEMIDSHHKELIDRFSRRLPIQGMNSTRHSMRPSRTPSRTLRRCLWKKKAPPMHL